MKTVRILVASDDEELPTLLRLVLLQETDLVLIGRARSGGELLALISDSPPDVVLVDLDAPGPATLSAISGMAALQMPRARVVGLAGNIDATQVLLGVADDLLLKQDSLDRLPAALRRSERAAATAPVLEERSGPAGVVAEAPAAPDLISLTVRPFSSFRSLAAFQQALEGLAGVCSPKTKSFHRGTLYATVQYDGAIPLAERLKGLGQFRPVVVANKPGSIELRIDPGE